MDFLTLLSIIGMPFALYFSFKEMSNVKTDSEGGENNPVSGVKQIWEKMSKKMKIFIISFEVFSLLALLYALYYLEF
jgi:hypothetical protein